jgi:hypothetical protein
MQERSDTVLYIIKEKYVFPGTEAVVMVLTDMCSDAKNMADKIAGIKEQIVGKMKEDPDLVQHGKGRRTGVLKDKEMEQDVCIPSRIKRHPILLF